jgi:hypothetical protein
VDLEPVECGVHSLAPDPRAREKRKVRRRAPDRAGPSGPGQDLRRGRT